jgi:hypothetical protein
VRRLPWRVACRCAMSMAPPRPGRSRLRCLPDAGRSATRVPAAGRRAGVEVRLGRRECERRGRTVAARTQRGARHYWPRPACGVTPRAGSTPATWPRQDADGSYTVVGRSQGPDHLGRREHPPGRDREHLLASHPAGGGLRRAGACRTPNGGEKLVAVVVLKHQNGTIPASNWPKRYQNVSLCWLAYLAQNASPATSCPAAGFAAGGAAQHGAGQGAEGSCWPARLGPDPAA